jgi:NAD/NADP transhydrogenase beta subunit
MHSLVGLAAVLIAIAAILHNNQLTAAFAENEAVLTAAGVEHAHMSKVHLFELFVGCFVGAITSQRLYLLTVNWLRRNGQKPFQVDG